MEQREKDNVIFIGIGGASGSGKTTMANLLQMCLPNSVIIHQDDFADPDKIPVNPELGYEDWDDAPTAIDYEKMAAELSFVKANGKLSGSVFSHAALNAQPPVGVDEQVIEKWRATFTGIGDRVTWAIVDGFLLYWSPAVYDLLDLKLFIRIPISTLKQRREERQAYFSGGIITTAGTMWVDPPGYWDKIGLPAYLRAHEDVFEGGDVEHGNSSGKIKGLVVIEGDGVSMLELLETTCARVQSAIQTT